MNVYLITNILIDKCYFLHSLLYNFFLFFKWKVLLHLEFLYFFLIWCRNGIGGFYDGRTVLSNKYVLRNVCWSSCSRVSWLMWRDLWVAWFSSQSDHNFDLPPPWTFHPLKLQPQAVARNDWLFPFTNRRALPQPQPQAMNLIPIPRSYAISHFFLPELDSITACLLACGFSSLHCFTFLFQFWPKYVSLAF